MLNPFSFKHQEQKFVEHFCGFIVRLIAFNCLHSQFVLLFISKLIIVLFPFTFESTFWIFFFFCISVMQLDDASHMVLKAEYIKD